jgi:hypothetical protein
MSWLCLLLFTKWLVILNTIQIIFIYTNMSGQKTNLLLIAVIIFLGIIFVGFTQMFKAENTTSRDESVSVPAIPAAESGTSTPVESPRQGAKIDPRVACESALMYTTFSSGEAADAFVADCVAGEHPEVIERYIEELGAPGALI